MKAHDPSLHITLTIFPSLACAALGSLVASAQAHPPAPWPVLGRMRGLWPRLSQAEGEPPAPAGQGRTWPRPQCSGACSPLAGRVQPAPLHSRPTLDWWCLRRDNGESRPAPALGSLVCSLIVRHWRDTAWQGGEQKVPGLKGVWRGCPGGEGAHPHGKGYLCSEEPIPPLYTAPTLSHLP